MAVETLNALILEAAQNKNRAGAAKLWDTMSASLEKRGSNYRFLLLGIRVAGAFESRDQKGLYKNYYAFFRTLDDIADDDIPTPEGFPDKVVFLKDMLAFISNPNSESDPASIIKLTYLEILRLSGQAGIDIQADATELLESLLFDAERSKKFKDSGKLEAISQEGLGLHFFQKDIRGTVVPQLKIYGEDPNYYSVFQPLGEAIRISYNIRDFVEDLKKGFLNIPAEELASLDLTEKDVHSFIPGNPTEETREKVARWCLQEARKGQKLIEKYEDSFKENKSKLKLITKIHPIGLTRAVKRVFEKVISANGLIDFKDFAKGQMS